MSYIKNIPIKNTVHSCIKYIVNPEKTNGYEFISDSGINFRIANNEWERVRNSYNKNDGIKAHHFIQSFDPAHGITPEEANKIGKELAEKQFGKMGFDFIVATHVDTGVIHNHILVNSVSRTNGKKYNHDKRTYRFLRQLNINVCRDNGIEAVDSRLKDINYDGQDIKDDMNLGKQFTKAPYIKTHAYDSWSEKRLTNVKAIRNDINESIKKVNSWDEFVSDMQSKGYKVDWKTKSGADKKYVTYTPDGAERGKRDRALGMDFFSKEAIIRRIKAELEKKRKELENQNTIRIRRSVKRKEKKEFVPKTKYYLNPNWDERKFYLGNSKYRKRGVVETLIIKSLLKQKLKVKGYEKSIYQKENSRKIKIDYSAYEKSKVKAESFSEMKRLINNHHIKNVDEIENVKNEYRFKLFIEREEQKELKQKLLKQENLFELCKTVNSIVLKVEIYNSLSGEEKKKYYYANKADIHKFNVAKRKLQQFDTNENKVLREVEDLKNELEKSDKNINSLEKNLVLLSEIKKIIGSKEKEKQNNTRNEKENH